MNPNQHQLENVAGRRRRIWPSTKPLTAQSIANGDVFGRYGSGMFTDLFVHRTTSMLKATGLRFPGRVVGAGGIYLEYDGRDVPDVATVVADFPEGVQGLVTATMACQETPDQANDPRPLRLLRVRQRRTIRRIRLHPRTASGDPQQQAEARADRVEKVADTSYAHFATGSTRWSLGTRICATTIRLWGPRRSPTVILGARSYREGKAFMIDPADHSVREADASLGDPLGRAFRETAARQAHRRLESRRHRQRSWKNRTT